MIDDEGTILLVNAQTERLFGYRREELLGEQSSCWFRSGFANAPGHRKRFFRRVRLAADGERTELFGRRKDGHEFPVEINLSPIKGTRGPLVTAAIRDISDRKRLEARYRTLVEGIPP